MSVSYQVYVGPYVQVHNPPKDAVKIHHGCSNEKCREYQRPSGTKYCSNCGTEIKLLTIPTKAPIHFDVYDETKGKLTEICRQFLPDPMKEYKFVVPNVGKTGTFLYEHDCEVIELNQTVITDTLCIFARDFMKEICHIKDFFGEENAIVKWGIISYSS